MGALHSVMVGLTAVCVAVFAVTWIIGAVYFGVRSGSRVADWAPGTRQTLVYRLALAVGVIAFVQLVRHTPGAFWHHFFYWQPVIAVVGAVVMVSSTALLVWARWVLGAMWAPVPVVRENQELRTGGPYAVVRHPIYTGLLGLVGGATLACGFGGWIVVFAFAVPWLLHRVRVEDGLMRREFGAQYETYRARVPALLPFPRPRPRGR
ncbi:isoprenylcysteine carboxylmethyltransferase family protein [Streptomyces sp. PTM05]|uniref:Isoprenylcysteine carboxylmethyltransferase family protein n=1 Tax=Streptantibioticus parmotrematis TaxID=2873249 RepID=A0ABS7QPR6_9ACTN|nr:isoprenylcysteine carboxylmethyltransferase family protein [Streptantibioticus parmotrematis]MBY8885191.1 isoprenylcysteine carboxylmethyltransferase family protein [Streptantibioticus parmotrematis]